MPTLDTFFGKNLLPVGNGCITCIETRRRKGPGAYLKKVEKRSINNTAMTDQNNRFSDVMTDNTIQGCPGAQHKLSPVFSPRCHRMIGVYFVIWFAEGLSKGRKSHTICLTWMQFLNSIVK